MYVFVHNMQHAGELKLNVDHVLFQALASDLETQQQCFNT